MIEIHVGDDRSLPDTAGDAGRKSDLLVERIADRQHGLTGQYQLLSRFWMRKAEPRTVCAPASRNAQQREIRIPIAHDNLGRHSSSGVQIDTRVTQARNDVLVCDDETTGFPNQKSAPVAKAGFNTEYAASNAVEYGAGGRHLPRHR